MEGDLKPLLFQIENPLEVLFVFTSSTADFWDAPSPYGPDSLRRSKTQITKERIDSRNIFDGIQVWIIKDRESKLFFVWPLDFRNDCLTDPCSVGAPIQASGIWSPNSPETV
jgi:hypothetical protein